ncbi:MAG: metalloregulator ArsR/SmtB family transcription factor [Candidatus Sumerlaeia bacterium]|nr:metalloregulator ArsR/SmtB family transcription factor [Candidatus Sumerlaeia bacterium]
MRNVTPPSQEPCCDHPSLGVAGVRRLKRSLPHAEDIDAASAFFALAGNPVRLKILVALRTQQELCVCDIAEVAEVSTAAVSAHLQRLKLGGLLCSRRVGQRVLYSLSDHPLHEVIGGAFPAEARA